MNCKDYLSIVDDYIEGSVDAHTSSQIAAHISTCGGCRTTYDELKNEQEMYSRYLLKINESPKSWNAVRKRIKRGSNVRVGTAGTGFYERPSAVFVRQPLFAGTALLVLIIALGFGAWYRNLIKNNQSVPVVVSTGIKDNEKRNVDSIPAQLPSGADTLVRDTSPILKPRVRHEKKRTISIYQVGVPTNVGLGSFDSSEAAFNRHIEKCEMVLRSFRNAATDESNFDVSYERRLAKELLNSSVNFRREAESQGNLPIEHLLVDVEAALADITRLPKKATSSDASVVKGRIHESGIIAKLQVQSSISLASN